MNPSVGCDDTLHGGMVWLTTIARPQRMNSLDDDAIVALAGVLSDAASSSSARAVVITGEGTRAFCAGSDLKAAQDMSPQQRIDHTARAQALMLSIESSPCLVIAAVEGYALGGGFELALACDLRVAGATAQFGLPEVAQGMLPTWGGTYRLARAVGLARAQSIMLGGVRVGTDEAVNAGLVMAAVPEGQAASSAVEMAADLVARSSRDIIARAKGLLRGGHLLDSAAASALELDAERVIAHSDAYNPTDAPIAKPSREG